MEELLSDEERDGDASASPLRSGSTDWELVLSTSSSPVLQSVDELSGMEIGGIRALSLSDLAFEPDRLVRDDYFGFEAGYADDVSPAPLPEAEGMNETAEHTEVEDVSIGFHGENEQTVASRLSVSPDTGSTDAFSPPSLFVEGDTDVRESTAEQYRCADDFNIDTGFKSSREVYQDDPALLSLPLPGQSLSVIDSSSSSNRNALHSDVRIDAAESHRCADDSYVDTGLESSEVYQDDLALLSPPLPVRSSCFIDPGLSSDLSTLPGDVNKTGEQGSDREGLGFNDDEGQTAVAAETQNFDSTLGNGGKRDGSGGNRLREASPSEGRKCRLGDCWLQRQLCLWQARLGQAKTLCSVTLAAALVGILILGRGWQRLRVQNRLLLLQLRAKDKKITQLMFQLLQMKESLSKTRQIPVIRAKPSLQIPQDIS